MKFVFGAKCVPIVGAAALTALVTAVAPAAAEPAPPPPVPAPAPAPLETDASPQAVTNSSAEPLAEGVPHLSSPENLPPGTSMTPVAPNQPRLTYLRDLWHAMRTQEVSGSDALLLLTQRPMVADAVPPRGMPTGPQSPPAAPAPDAEPAPPPAAGEPPLTP